ncbi:MAG: hypothetical protein JRJ59_11495 [Deltaproteobacteria bacterium]|nr:hypothetical protein [Deltaproteobacteria bacterium]
MPGEERIRLVVGGREMSDWVAYSVDSDLFMPADDFELQIMDFTGRHLREIRRSLGATVQLYVGRELILTGRLDEPEASIQRSQRHLILRGRDLAGWLVDCCPDPDKSEAYRGFKNLTLKQVAQKVCPEFGVNQVRVQGDGGRRIDLCQIIPGQKVWDFLAEYAAKQRLGLWLDVDGTLIIGQPSNKSPTKSLYHSPDPGRSGAVNAWDWSLTDSLAERYSKVVVQAQSKGDDYLYAEAVSQIQSEVQDEELTAAGVHRPWVVKDHEGRDAAQAKRLAQGEINRGRREGFKLSVTVRGHTQNGRVWRPGELVKVEAGLLDLSEDLLLTGRTLRFDRQGSMTTDLRLSRAGVWP